LRVFAEDEAMSVEFAVVELDLKVTEPLAVEVPTCLWSVRITTLGAPDLVLRTLLIATVFCSLVHFWWNMGGFHGLDGCRSADCRFVECRIVDCRFVGYRRRGW
jgi:hypothetical protein